MIVIIQLTPTEADLLRALTWQEDVGPPGGWLCRDAQMAASRADAMAAIG